MLLIAKNITGNDEDAKECVNDAYLAAWNTIPPSRPEHLGAFLSRIVRNVSYNRFHHDTAQKRNATMVSLTSELSEILPDEREAVSDEGLSEAINAFLRTQSEEAQRVFVRRYFYADSLQNIARLIGKSENSVTLLLHRMRKKLRTYLEQEGFTI